MQPLRSSKMRNNGRGLRISRRKFVSGMAAGALLLPRWPGLSSPDAPRCPFEEIPPEKSGIRWVHFNAKSEDKYLPETTGRRLRISRL